MLYVGSLGPGRASTRRCDLFRQEGWTLSTLDVGASIQPAPKLDRLILLRIQAGPLIARLSAALRESARSLAPGDVVFFDKPVFFTPQDIGDLSRSKLQLVSYMPDDPFGPRQDGLWRLFKKIVPLFDLHIVPRKISAREFLAQGARRVVLQPFSFDPVHQFPNPSPIHETSPFPNRISYIGSPHEDRPRFLLRLKQRLEAGGERLTVCGPRWSHWKYAKIGRALSAGEGLWGTDYRDGIWRSAACLAFLTRLNRDEISHKAIEIAACGRPPVLEHCPEHDRVFVDGESAIFFDSVEECAEKLLFYKDNDGELTRMGRNAARRVRELGFSEQRIVDIVEENLP